MLLIYLLLPLKCLYLLPLGNNSKYFFAGCLLSFKMVFDFFSIRLRYILCKDGKLTPIVYSECLITDDKILKFN